MPAFAAGSFGPFSAERRARALRQMSDGPFSFRSGGCFFDVPTRGTALSGRCHRATSMTLIHKKRTGLRPQRFDRSLPAVSRQIIGQTNPRQAIFGPGVVGGQYSPSVVEAANRDVNLVGSAHERQRGATLRAERTLAASPAKFSRPTANKPKLISTKGSPGNKGRAAAAAAVQTMAMSNVVGLPGCLIANRAAQATAAETL